MDNETLAFIVGLSGAIVAILLGVIGYFMKTIHKDVKDNTESSGKNRGQIQLVAQRQEDDIKRVEELTQLELKIMAEKVGELSSNVSNLVQLFIEDKNKK